METSLLNLSLLILASILGCSAEVEPRNTTADVIKECSKPEVKTEVEEFNSSGNWVQLQANLEGVLDNRTVLKGQVLLTSPVFAMYLVGRHNRAELASLLLCAGLQVDTADVDGETMLHGAATGGHLGMVRMLLDHGADVDARSNRGETALMKAAYFHHLQVVKLLVGAGADTSLRLGNATAWDMSDGAVEEYLSLFPH